MILLKFDTEILKAWNYWKYLRALREIENYPVPPNDDTRQNLQNAVYKCVDIARFALREAKNDT